MHKVTMKSGQALYAKCPSCKGLMQVHSNPNKGPMSLAFNHPKQSFDAKCPGCAKDFTWTPEELVAAEIAASC
ncbi:MAG: hypothetical protein JWO13_3766 [Acidobacteriales bacterium]|nr:hypothetical protein [Terriglobales bacterium]